MNISLLIGRQPNILTKNLDAYLHLRAQKFAGLRQLGLAFPIMYPFSRIDRASKLLHRLQSILINNYFRNLWNSVASY